MSLFSRLCVLLSAVAVALPLPILINSNALLQPLLQTVEAPNPYEFSYDFGDGLGMTQHRQENSDANGDVRGQYGYLDPLGVYRTVEYTAGADGYKAVVKSNEPGTANQQIGDAVFVIQPPPPAVTAQGLQRNVKWVSV